MTICPKIGGSGVGFRSPRLFPWKSGQGPFPNGRLPGFALPSTPAGLGRRPTRGYALAAMDGKRNHATGPVASSCLVLTRCPVGATLILKPKGS